MEKQNKMLKVLVVLLCVVVAVELGVILKTNKFVSNDTKEEVQSTQEVVEDASLDNITESKSYEVTLNTIETSKINLVYDTEAVEMLKARVDQNDAVTLLADIGEVKDIELFTIYFDDDSRGNAVGIAKDKNGTETKVSVEKNSFLTLDALNSSDISRLTSVQEDLLDMIFSNMVFEEVFNVITDAEYIEIETPYVTLMYPKEWEEYLMIEQVEGEPYKVEFYCKLQDKEPKQLFAYVFGDEADMLIGYFEDTKVGIQFGTEEAEESWTEKEKEIFYTMRESMGAVIDNLVYVEGFSLN